MAQINIQLDTSRPADLKMLERLLDIVPIPPVARATFPPITAGCEVPEAVPGGAANVGFVSAAITHGSPELDEDAAKLEALAGPGSAGPTPPAPPAPAGQTQELDAAGLPWDARIHSESRARIADNTWRRKRGVDQAIVDSVTAELRAAYPAPTGQSAPAPTPPAAEAPNPFPVQPAERTDLPPPPAASVSVPPPPAVAPPAPAARGVTDLAAAVARGVIKLDDLNAACLSHGCANVLELNKNPVALMAVCAQFELLGAFKS